MPRIGDADSRPWGHWRTVDVGAGFQVKRITVFPGARLSLQSHKHRREHWVVLSGTAEATVGTATHRLTAGAYIDVPAGASHRLANVGDAPLVITEVQFGEYLEEDDITRYEDDFGRA